MKVIIKLKDGPTKELVSTHTDKETFVTQLVLSEGIFIGDVWYPYHRMQQITFGTK
jgi:hypothetical protein